MTKLHAISKSLQRVAIAAIIFSALMMIMHWKYNGDILFYSQILFVLSSIVNLLTAPSKTYGHWAGLLALLLTSIYYLNLDFLLFLDSYLLILGGICGFIWYWDIGMERSLMGNFLPFAPNQSILSRVLWISSTITIVMGALFKIMHWEYGNALLIVGMVVAAIGAVLPYVRGTEDPKD